MNYSYSLTGAVGFTRSLPGFTDGTLLRVNARLDYARAPVLPNLNEAGLNENAGVNGANGLRILYGLPVPAASPAGIPLIGPANGSVDWNGNGAINPTPVSGDINRNNAIGDACVASSPNETLTGFDDWGNLLYNFYGATNFSDGILRYVDPNGPEFTPDQILNAATGSTDVDNDGVANISDNCIFASNPSQADSNGNGIGDACDPLTTILADVSVTMAESADPVQINTSFDYTASIRNAGPNASQNVNFNYTLPAGVTLNSVTPSQGSCSGTTSIVCSLGMIGNNSTATVTIRVTPTVRGKLDSWVSANSSGGSPTADPNFLNNTGSASTTIVDPSQTFTISGRIADAGNIGIAGAFVVYSGSPGGAAQTDVNGNYSFSVASGGTYTLAPYKFGFNFNPQSRTVAYINSNQVVDFTGFAVVTTAKNSDFDGDGRTDISVFRPTDSGWYVFRSSDASYQTTTWGVSTDKLAPGDYDGDGKTDQAVFRPSNGGWYILQSTNGAVYSLTWGVSSDIPVAGDYDGDGKTDIAVWRPSDGNWYVIQSSNQSQLIVSYGQNGDVPLVGDFDGDRKTDFAVFSPIPSPTSPMWNILRSTGGTVTRQFGVFSDKPAPADYDGDGTTDFGVWRPSSGVWYTAPSFELDPSHNFTAIPFGINGDVPVPGDYNGDGKYDRAVFRSGNWYVFNLTDSSVSYFTFGVGTDKPIPNAYVPQ